MAGLQKPKKRRRLHFINKTEQKQETEAQRHRENGMAGIRRPKKKRIALRLQNRRKLGPVDQLRYDSASPGLRKW
ncbi:hypothetical protein KFK09_006466 [Dendrobium nobile]|uniref:Uncharacterized protein n=1 Tax=Dendrobium nobile TaxID=94219 RepID=A0A8T3BTL1_DENNO|nr:hypothetical protein KFK09_006466 [Dendrobium nobile]